jgi:hypothetical protein
MLEHRWLDVDSIDDALGMGPRQPHGEVTGARADIGHRGVARQHKRLEHAVRQLSGVACRIVE